MECKRRRLSQSFTSSYSDMDALEQPLPPDTSASELHDDEASDGIFEPIVSIDPETLSILNQCPRLCDELTPCYMWKYLSLPKDVPLHWEILCLFFMEP